MFQTAFNLTEENGLIKPQTVRVINESDLNQHDILCGRGSGPNDYCGNKHFLELVAARRNEYLATKSRIVKARIAQEIILDIRSLEPPGRFLERVQRKNKKGSSLWMIVRDERKCLEKVKQACRETWHRRDEIRKIKNVCKSIDPISKENSSEKIQESFLATYLAKRMKQEIHDLKRIERVENSRNETSSLGLN